MFLSIYVIGAAFTFAFICWWERRFPTPVLARPVNRAELLSLAFVIGVLWPLWWPIRGPDVIRTRNGRRLS